MDKRARASAVLALLVIAAASHGCGKIKARRLGIEPPSYRVKVERNLMVEMSDGVRLATDVYMPAGLDKAPVILVRTPYGKNMMSLFGGNDTIRLLVRRGYIVVVQDVRGRYGSEGEFYPFIYDGPDGKETMAWIREQEWFDGRLGTWGGSYLGATQWFSAPGEDIDAMHLTVTSPDLKEVIYTGGGLHLMTIYFWSVMMGEHKADLEMAAKLNKLDDYIYTLPLDEADDKAGRDVDYFDDSLDPKKIWGIYEQVNFEESYDEVKAPAVFVAGWYDMFLGPQLDDFKRLIEEGGGEADQSVLIVGPWGHGSGGDGSVDYGEEADRKDMTGPAHILAWYDHRLKGRDSGADDWPRVRIFVMGENAWRDEDEWPLARTEYTDYYLHSGGGANTRHGDGVLSTEPPGDEPADEFDYDPKDPVPTRGGNNLGMNLGAYDQSEIEEREDVLCYTTPPLAEGVEVTGEIKAIIWASTDAVDTDFTVKLVDVYPDGTAVNIQDGIVRAMYRDNDPLHPTPLQPGRIEEYEVELWATSNLFKAGHRIRVEVSSSNFPRFNRNLNTGEPVPGATRTEAARQKIYHDAKHPSRIVLPVIPRQDVKQAASGY